MYNQTIVVSICLVITQALKIAGCSKRWLPLVSLLIGLAVVGIAYWDKQIVSVWQMVYDGIVAGGLAVGIHSTVKNMILAK